MSEKEIILAKIKELLQSLEDPDRIIWTGDNLKEVIDFVGKAPWFDEWFKSWEEYEVYVKSHNNIFKIFSLGGHYEIYPECEIQKSRAFESCVPITDKKYQFIINGLQCKK